MIFMSDLAVPGDDQRKGSELVYMRIVNDISEQIASGQLRPGVRLRSERDLAEHYGAAYTTVRKALSILQDRGLIQRIHGRGTYVAEEIPDSR
jgi:GntR family transcriptional regulator